MNRYLILPALLLSGAALANEVSTLLPAEAVERAVEDHPLVQASIARSDAARGAARGQRAGPYEFTVSGSYARRRIDREGEFSEYDVTLERGFRLPGKAALDRRAGEFGVAAADYRIAGARHSAVQLLNDIWWDWLAAGAEIKANEAAVANLTADLTSVERRVALQDAAPVEDGGFVVLLVPKQGAAGAVEASEVDEAASTAGLHASESAPVGDNWRATRLVAPRSRSRR